MQKPRQFNGYDEFLDYAISIHGLVRDKKHVFSQDELERLAQAAIDIIPEIPKYMNQSYVRGFKSKCEVTAWKKD